MITATLLLLVAVDSTPHFCDSKADIIRVARIASAQGLFFGTEPFCYANLRGFCGKATIFQVRLYHL